MPTALKIIVYPLFAGICLVLFSIVLFPFDSVKNRLAREMETRLGGTYAISIGDLSPSLLAGVVLKDVEIRPRGDSNAQPVKLSKAKLKFGFFSLLSGNLDVRFDLRAGQGRADGSLSWKKGSLLVNAEMKAFDLSLAGFLAQKVGVPITGLVSGKVEMEVFPQDPLKNTGKILLDLPDLSLGEINLAAGAFQIPAMRLTGVTGAGGPSRLEVLITKGNFEVKQFRLEGGDLDIQASGKIYGARKMENYRFNLQGSFKAAAQVAEKIPLLLMVEKQKAADGSYPFTITGRISKPNIRIGEFKLPI